MSSRSIVRRGFTLVELLLSLVVTAIVGGALIRMVLSQARFMDQQEAWRGARGVARGGINRLVSDLRAVEVSGGLQAAAAGGQDFTVRVPYAFGIICVAAGATATVSLLPVDSAMYNAPGHSGFAVRRADGTYDYYTSTTANLVPAAGVANNCLLPALPDLPITTLGVINGSPAGKVAALSATANLNPLPPKGSIVFLYRRIRYEFKNSTALPGRTGLFRTPLSGVGSDAEELATPFANTARVNFYVLNNAVAQAGVPAPLSDARGLELLLDGMSERTPGGSTAPKTANVKTSVLNSRGATLPLTIIVIAIMGVAVAISYARLSSERRITGDGQAQVDAFSVAQSGLNNYLATRNGKPAASQDTTFTNLPGGTAQVSVRMLRESTTTLLPAVYVITSRGTNTTATRYDARTPAAERTVATYALWTPAPFDLDAAFTSLSGIDKNGNSGTLNGTDACGANPAIAGVAVPNGMYTGQTGPIDGNPDNTPKQIGTAGVAGTARDSVSIDWAGIRAGTVLPPDYIYPTTAWPSAAQFANWPVVKVNGDLNFPGDGKGILIVTGNMTISGNNRWDGLVMVGGTFTSNGNNTIQGALMTGLNIKVGIAVPQTAVGNGNKTIQYSSCNLTRALGHVGSIQRVRNGWTDTWSSY
jgi:prepilin-type N-terminal cleavage/methylation domain-containing protein